MSSSPIYLDYASTYPRNQDIVRATEEFALHHYANIGRGRYALAEEAEIHYTWSKKLLAQWIDCEPIEVIYTYSATYACNLLALTLEHNGVISAGDTIILSVSEHHANIVPWQMLAKRMGAHIRFVGLDENYCIDLHHLSTLMDDTVKVVSLQYASNVTGARHPIEKVRSIIGDTLFFVDAVQMGVYGGFSFQSLQCDGLVLSWHKMMADTGIGVLALRRVWQKIWQAPISGGWAINTVTLERYEQAGIPDRWEPGTPHITGAFSLGAAVQYLSEGVSTKHQYHTVYTVMQRYFESFEKKGVRVFHSSTPEALGIWSFSLPGKHPNDIADALALEGICVRSGHHCCEPLHTYFCVPGTVRVSIGYETTVWEVEHFFAVLESFL